MSALELKIYDLFKNRFNEEEAKLVIQYFESKSDEKYEQKKDILLTKDDKLDLVSKIESTKVDIIKWVFGFFATLAFMIIGLYLKK